MSRKNNMAKYFQGPKKGWISLEARIISLGKASNKRQMDLSKIVYTADVHTSGEIRRIKYSGNIMPDLGENADQMTPQMKEMMQSWGKEE